MDSTDSHGVDVVLNSLSEDKLQASVRCMAPHGRFLEIGKFDMAKNSPLGLGCFLKNITFHGILLDALFDCENDGADVCRLLNEGIEKGVVQPLPATVYQANEVQMPKIYFNVAKVFLIFLQTFS
jgi:fatty acid synthase